MNLQRIGLLGIVFIKSLSISNAFSLYKKNNIYNTVYPTQGKFNVKQSLKLSKSDEDTIDSTLEMEDVKRQWDLFKENHVNKNGRWRGTWNTYDYMGDEIDSTLASVVLKHDDDDGDDDESTESISHTHEIITGITSADCNTCFDSTQSRTIPIGKYMYDTKSNESNLSQRKMRLASVGMSVGPTLLRSGVMSTELILRHGDSRLRVIYMHGPAWEKNVEPGSCPPMGLKLFRTLVSRESMISDNRPFPGPTAENERDNPPLEGNPQFFRPVPPFQWHAKWKGSSWTYGEQSGDKGWAIEEMDDQDSWHGRPTGDNENVWSLRLPGGILLQCPRIVYPDEVGICRLAWMPEGERGPHMLGSLLRLEAGITALQPIVAGDDEYNDQVIGFHPPALVNLRCDTLRKVGELENASQLQNRKIINNDQTP